MIRFFSVFSSRVNLILVCLAGLCTCDRGEKSKDGINCRTRNTLDRVMKTHHDICVLVGRLRLYVFVHK